MDYTNPLSSPVCVRIPSSSQSLCLQIAYLGFLLTLALTLMQNADLCLSMNPWCWPKCTAVTVVKLTYWPVMVTRVPPATGPYDGRTLSTEISLGDTVNSKGCIIVTRHSETSDYAPVSPRRSWPSLHGAASTFWRFAPIRDARV